MKQPKFKFGDRVSSGETFFTVLTIAKYSGGYAYKTSPFEEHRWIPEDDLELFKESPMDEDFPESGYDTPQGLRENCEDSNGKV